MTLTAGSSLQNGRYTIQSVISQGEIDITYAAKHTYLNQFVRIKTLQNHVRSHYEDINVREEFTHRAARFARSDNPHLVPVIDGFEEDWMPFLVLKMVLGTCLAHRLPHMSLVQTVGVMRQLVSAVQFLHDQNLVHGNLSLDNVVVRDESPSEALDIVLTGIGLRSFMPSLAQAIDQERLDVFSPAFDLQCLTVLLCELLTGQSQSLSDLRLAETRPDMRSRHSQLPDSLDQVLAQGLNPEAPLSVSDWFAQVEPMLVQAAESADLVVGQSPVAKAERLDESASIETATAADESTANQSDPDSSELAASASLLSQSMSLETFPEAESEPAYSEVGHATSGDTSTMTTTHLTTHASETTTQSSSRRRSWKISAALALTSLVAAVGGGYFGLSFRLQEPEDLERSPIFGREIFGSEQSFPASDNWPGQSTYDDSNRTPLFETPDDDIKYSRPSALELDNSTPPAREYYESQPRQIEASPIEEVPPYEFRDDLNLSTDGETFPDEDSSVDYQRTSTPEIESDRPLTPTPTPTPTVQPAPAPPPPSASTNSTVDILVAPTPINIEAPPSTQLNGVPKPTSNSNSL